MQGIAIQNPGVITLNADKHSRPTRVNETTRDKIQLGMFV